MTKDQGAEMPLSMGYMWRGIPLHDMPPEALRSAVIELADMLEFERARHADELRRTIEGLA